MTYAAAGFSDYLHPLSATHMLGVGKETYELKDGGTVSSCCSIYVLILLCMRPNTTMFVSSYCYVCVLMLLQMSS